ncbi:MAG TPA: bifunctional phosphoglucose/phosphomannose isomerase [Flavobacteriales bacterium]|nr:bifunctional phosphoglucose/phosphomannose isomerase [Flavobacteriales bacterium]
MDMHDLIDGFGKQLHNAVEIAKTIDFTPVKPIHNVLISGLGGSGIGGNIAAEIAQAETKYPIQVSKTYFIPGYVNENTLVIISSYSGNTEETFHALELAYKKGAQIVCITSGGKIADFAKKQGLPHVIIPGGMPPRACLGFSLVQQLALLHKIGCIVENPLPKINNAANYIITNKAAIMQQGRHIAAFIFGKFPILYTTTYNEGIAIRWRQQINENSKQLCSHHVVPEMNHNELVGWRKKDDALAVLFLRTKTEYTRNNTRIEINKEVIHKYTANVLDVYANGDEVILQTIHLIHLGDWVSLYLAQLNEKDPIEIEVINHLKGELDKI